MTLGLWGWWIDSRKGLRRQYCRAAIKNGIDELHHTVGEHSSLEGVAPSIPTGYVDHLVDDHGHQEQVLADDVQTIVCRVDTAATGLQRPTRNISTRATLLRLLGYVRQILDLRLLVLPGKCPLLASGQEWIWEPGGFGVFDPGINALSLIPTILPSLVYVSEAEIAIPANRFTPISARIRFLPADGTNADLTAEFDWLQTGEPSWDIEIETSTGMNLTLGAGGTQL